MRLVLIAAGLLFALNADAQDPMRVEALVRAFETEDANLAPAAETIVFVGSSSIAQWKTIHEDMAPLKVINRGVGGSTMQDLVYWVDTLVLRYKPRAVVIYEGDNDIGQYGAKAEAVLAEFRTLVSRIHMQLPTTQVYFLSIKPSAARWDAWPEMRRANTMIRAHCAATPKLSYLDVANPLLDWRHRPRGDFYESDTLHLSAAGYAAWSSVVKAALLRHEKRS